MHLRFIFLALLFTYPVFADLGKITPDIFRDKKEFSGQWKGGEEWEGFLCDGESHYNVKVKGKIGEIDVEVKDPNTAKIQVELLDNKGDLFGSYRASKALCVPFRLGLKLGIDRISVLADVLSEEVEGVLKVKLKIKRTEFEGLHFGESVSPAMESFCTKLLNKGFRWVWKSKVGAWIEQRISEEINSRHGRH